MVLVLLYLAIDGGGAGDIDPAHALGLQRRWRMTGGVLRSTGQNSIALYVLSESVAPMLSSVCWSSGHEPGPSCHAGGGSVPEVSHDNTLVGVIYRGR